MLLSTHAQKSFCLIPDGRHETLYSLSEENPFHDGGRGMKVFKTDARYGFIFVALFTAMVILGCYSASGVKYIYDPRTSFSGLNSYAWTTPGQQESLVVTNVKFAADQILEQKGFKKTSENPDLLISINYTDASAYYNEGYLLSMLSLNIYRRESKELIWRGTASVDIRTDSASSDLKNAVWDILAKFPPK
jgi:hypothetical protein